MLINNFGVKMTTAEYKALLELCNEYTGEVCIDPRDFTEASVDIKLSDNDSWSCGPKCHQITSGRETACYEHRSPSGAKKYADVPEYFKINRLAEYHMVLGAIRHRLNSTGFPPHVNAAETLAKLEESLKKGIYVR